MRRKKPLLITRISRVQASKSFPESPKLPAGCYIDDSGSLFGEDEQGELIQITNRTPFAATAILRRYDGTGWQMETCHRDADGRIHWNVFSAADITNRRISILSVLANTGLNICPGRGKALLTVMQRIELNERLIVTQQAGWVGECYESFATSNQVIGNIGGEVVKFQARTFFSDRR